MPSDRAVLERQLAEVEVRPCTVQEFHRRRRRKRRNHRIAAVTLALALVAVVAGSVAQALGEDDDEVDVAVLGPGPSPFDGEWTSVDRDGSSQTMEIRLVQGVGHEVLLRDDDAAPCSGGPSTEAGIGQVRTPTMLVARLELTCDGASTPRDVATLTFRFHPGSDQLTDDIGVVWQRAGGGGRPEEASPGLEGSSPFVGSWVVGEPGTYFPDSLEIRLVGDDDLHETVSLKAETPQCSGGASTMTGRGRRELEPLPDAVRERLVVTVRLTCDDGSPPSPQRPEEEVVLDEFEISFAYDPGTDELLGSLGSTFVRAGG